MSGVQDRRGTGADGHPARERIVPKHGATQEGPTTRDVAAASGTTYDLIVVGGGIHGICATLEAARAGCKVLLLERGTPAGETSANSLQILHGGFRYLQDLDVGRLRESVRARSWWLGHFPDLCEPLECLLPLDGRGVRRPPLFRLALAAYGLFARDADPALLRGEVVSAAQRPQLAELFPEPRPRAFAVWFDGLFPQPRRLADELLRWATAAGAVVLPRMEARTLLLDRDSASNATLSASTVVGVRARDHETDREVELRASRVLDTAGPWNGWWRGTSADSASTSRLHPPSVAFNLLFRGQLPDSCALAARAPDGMNLFLWERDGCIHAGTRHLPWTTAVNVPSVTSADVASLVDDLRCAVPGLGLAESNLVEVQVGFLPARAPGAAEMARRDRFEAGPAAGAPRGLVSVSGVKYTTAPVVARQALAMLFGAPLSIRSDAARPAISRVPAGER
ncbi:MAG: FAD-dependent oxidoreductase [Candidatus Eisenbacteria bacterium]|uniref:FAD-dependent oxidoreductase n=1 Tax=Eiseniibacteriota bacterium TaxID=2212470 RepID=A0A956RNC1_UNCEI|nr:FAD-dependent oxidoreductase [Candidatus Eisenbacteria bacterium]